MIPWIGADPAFSSLYTFKVFLYSNLYSSTSISMTASAYSLLNQVKQPLWLFIQLHPTIPLNSNNLPINTNTPPSLLVF